jgi:hypothetical protein
MRVLSEFDFAPVHIGCRAACYDPADPTIQESQCPDIFSEKPIGRLDPYAKPTAGFAFSHQFFGSQLAVSSLFSE